MKKKAKGILFIIGVLGLWIFLFSGVDLAWAKDPDYPTKPITFYITHGAGAVSDLQCRAFCEAVSPHLGQPFIPINKPGSGGALAQMAITNAKPDGYTMGLVTTAQVVFLPNTEECPYKDLSGFTPIARFGVFLFIVSARSDAPYKTWKEMIEWARKNPRGIKVAIPQAKSLSSQGVAMWQVEQKEKVEFTYIVAKAGTPESLALILGRHIDIEAMAIDRIRDEHIKQGTLRYLAFISKEKAPGYEHIPSFQELYGFSRDSFLGVWGPRGLPNYVVKKLDDAIAKGVRDPKFINSMEQFYSPVVYRNRADFTKEVAEMFSEGSELLKKIRAEDAKEKK